MLKKKDEGQKEEVKASCPQEITRLTECFRYIFEKLHDFKSPNLVQNLENMCWSLLEMEQVY